MQLRWLCLFWDWRSEGLRHLWDHMKQRPTALFRYHHVPILWDPHYVHLGCLSVEGGKDRGFLMGYERGGVVHAQCPSNAFRRLMVWILILIWIEKNKCKCVCEWERESPPVGKSAFTHEVGQWNLPKLGQWQSMGAILDKRENKREREREGG